MSSSQFYNHYLTQIHHKGYGHVAEHAGQTILQIIERENKPSQKIIELGCGSGITAKLLSEAGHKVLGVDYSASMINLARREATKATFHQQSLFDFDFPPCDMVLSIGQVLNYLFDGKSNLENLNTLFGDIYKSLNSKGLFVFDVLLNGTIGEESPKIKLVDNENWTLFVEISEDPTTQILTRDIRLFYKEGALYRKNREIHRQRLFNEDDLRLVLNEIGFEVEVSNKYGELELGRGYRAFFCKKKPNS